MEQLEPGALVDVGIPARKPWPQLELREQLRGLLSALRQLPCVAMFANSRILAVATLVLGAFSLSPLFMTPFLPLVDLGSNVGAAMLLNDALWGHGVVSYYYQVQHGVVPYWTAYLALAALEPFFGVLLGTKIFVGFLVLLLPLAVMRLLVALGRSPLLGLWAFMLTWDLNLFWGWISFQLGMALALWGMAWLIEAKSWRDAIRVSLLGAVLSLTHIHAVAFALTIGGLITLLRRPFWRSLAQGMSCFAGLVLTVLPWLIHRGSLGAGPAGGIRFEGEQHKLVEKLSNLHEYSLNCIPEQQWLTVTAVMLCLFAPAAFSALPTRRLSALQRRAPLAILTGTLLLYLALPYSVVAPIDHFWTYPRFATYILIALLLFPSIDFTKARLATLLPGVAVAVLIHCTVARQFAGFAEYTRPYLKIMQALPPNSRFLALDYDNFRYKGTQMPSYGQLHGFAAAATSSYDGHLFNDPSNPLLFRADHSLPNAHFHNPSRFSMERNGRYFDYIIVHPPEHDPFTTGARRGADQVELVVDANPWRMYRVKNPVPMR